jgi:hypothetical protein
MQREPLALGLIIFSCAGRVGAQTPSVPEANPGRPTVSTPATLAPVGYLQFETGLLGAATSPEFSSRLAIGQVTKLAVLPRLEFFLQTEPLVHSIDERITRPTWARFSPGCRVFSSQDPVRGQRLGSVTFGVYTQAPHPNWISARSGRAPLSSSAAILQAFTSI